MECAPELCLKDIKERAVLGPASLVRDKRQESTVAPPTPALFLGLELDCILVAYGFVTETPGSGTMSKHRACSFSWIHQAMATMPLSTHKEESP